MPIRRYAWSVRVTAGETSKAVRLRGGPNTWLEVVNAGLLPAFVAPGSDETVTVAAITGEWKRSIYIPAGAAVDFELAARSHLAVLCAGGETDLIIMQGVG